MENNCSRDRVVPREVFDRLTAMFQAPSVSEGTAVSRSAWDSICRIQNDENRFLAPEFLKGEPFDCSI